MTGNSILHHWVCDRIRKQLNCPIFYVQPVNKLQCIHLYNKHEYMMYIMGYWGKKKAIEVTTEWKMCIILQ